MNERASEANGTGRVSESELVKTAKLYFTYDSSGKARYVIKQIAGILNISTRTVSRHVRAALSKGLVEIRFPPSNGVSRDNDRLAFKLANKYPNIQHALVVNMPAEVLGERDIKTRSDKIHEQIADRMAEHLIHIIRDGDHIGLSGGRGVFKTCFALKYPLEKQNIPRFKRIRLSSLTGSVGAEFWTPRMNATLDPEDAMREFRAICASAVQQTHLDSIIKEGFAHDDDPLPIEKWQREAKLAPHIFATRPNWALVGCGHLVRGHRLLQDSGDHFHPIQGQLSQLKKLIEQAGYRKFATPIGDICNYMFMLNSMVPKEEKKLKLFDEMEELIRSINSSMNCATPEHLSTINHLFFVAGGRHKSNVIHEILTNILPQSRITLCTDAGCAELLLSFA